MTARRIGFSAWCSRRALDPHEQCGYSHCVCWCHETGPQGQFAAAAKERRRLREILDASQDDLFEEESKPLKAQRGDLGPKRRETMQGGEMGPYFEGMAGGAPPLDWWLIADEVCVCGLRHVREGAG